MRDHSSQVEIAHHQIYILLFGEDLTKNMTLGDQQNIDETSHLVVNASTEDIDRMAVGNIKVYKRRWYILTIFTLLNTTGNILWNTWPPIQETCQLVFGWDKTNVLIIGALQALGSIISIVPSAWLLDTKGERF